MCVQEIEADPKRRGRFKPYHAIICCRDGHADSVDAKSIDSFKSLYGDGVERLCVGLASIWRPQSELVLPLVNPDVKLNPTDKQVVSLPGTSSPLLSKCGEGTRERKVDVPSLGPYLVGTEEYPDNLEPILFDLSLIHI